MNKIFIIFLILTAFYNPLFSAEGNNRTEDPDISIGINANFGAYDIYSNNFNTEINPGLYIGVGLTVEKMISNRFGLGSGLQYRYFNTSFLMDDGTYLFTAKWTYQSVNLPLVMILSFRGDYLTLNLSAGAVYSHIFYSVMSTDQDVMIPTKRDNVLRFTRGSQIGATAGITFKLKATDFTDVILGFTGEYYPANLLVVRNQEDTKLNMYNYSISTGYMFRTNLFSGSGKNNL